MNLFDIANRMSSGDPITKPLSYYKKYDEFMKRFGTSPPRTILEIGVCEGTSTKVLGTAFPNSKIVAVDLNVRKIDFSIFPNLTYIKADQANSEQLISIIREQFPSGIDLVIDDASHIGQLSKITFDAVFPFVVSGGFFFIEDWGTGYWDDWVDGSRFQEFPVTAYRESTPKRVPSHDFGMVGFVKSLVDMTHESAIRNKRTDSPQLKSRIAVLEFGEGVCMALKA